MKVCRWKSKPPIICFAALLIAICLFSYKTFSSTAERPSQQVFIRGAYRAENMRPSKTGGTLEPIEVRQPGLSPQSNALVMQFNSSDPGRVQTTSGEPHYVPSRRIVHLDLKGAPLKPDRFRAFFEYFAKLGITGVLIEWEDMFPYGGRLSSVRNGDAYSADEVRRILREASEFGLEVIPLVQTIGHLEWILKVPEFADLRENAKYPQAICVSNDKAVSLVLDMIDQMMAFHENAEFVHIGCDEVYQYGECSRCLEELKEQESVREELVIRHMAKVARHVKERYHKKVIVWHDFLTNVAKSTADKHGLRSLVEPMLWNYAEDLGAYMMPGIWDLFSDISDYMWAASAFKGADGPARYHSNVRHYLQNHISWIGEMKVARSKFKDFRGLVFTGWQRYDHLTGLCELLPVGIPSLTVNVLTIRNGAYSSEVDKWAVNMLHCLSGSEMLGEIYGCVFPGSEIYTNVQTLHRTVKEIEDQVLRSHAVQGWLSTYNIDHNTSSPWILKSFLPELDNYRWQVKSISDSLEKSLSEIYFSNTVEEFLATYVDPIRLQLDTLYQQGSALMARNFFPIRPFPIKRLIKDLSTS